jgi:hypothetical protein
MSIDVTFNPAYTKGVTVAPGTVSAASTVGVGSKSLCITNLGAVVVYVRVGGFGVVATAADYPVLPSVQLSISKDQDATHVAYVTASGTGSLHMIPGEGF